MNSQRAAAVRDSLMGCPEIVDPEDVNERRDREPFETTQLGNDVKLTGDQLDLHDSRFLPPRIEEVGTFAHGDAERPVFVVVLDAAWLDDSDVRSLSPELVYEIAKHDCRIRFYPPDHLLDGDVWICDHFGQDITDTDGERCECGSTYFKLRDGEPECARCGRVQNPNAQQTLTEATR